MHRKRKSVAEILSKNVRGLRERKKFSQEDLAKRADLPRSTISNIESERYAMPRGGVLEGIAEALDVSLSELFGELAGISDGARTAVARVRGKRTRRAS